jgi:CHAT domain-containing protein/Tfp pilus assembly protein PilF
MRRGLIGAGRWWLILMLALPLCGEIPAADPEEPQADENQGTAGASADEIDAIRSEIEEGRYAEAEAAARELLKEVEASDGSDSLQAARVLDVLVEALTRSGGLANHPDARTLGERAVEIKERHLGADHPEVADSLLNIGIVLTELGELPQAMPYLERALAIREKVLSPTNPEVAIVLDNLAVVLIAMGDLEQAQAYLERAVLIREKTLGPETPSMIPELTNLAMIQEILGDIEGASAAYIRLIELVERELGHDHAAVGKILSNFGKMLLEEGAYAEAKVAFERSAKIQKEVLGAAHYSVARVLNNLGDALDGLGSYEAARRYHLRALSIMKRGLGPEHPEVANIHNSLALSDYLAGETTRALGHSMRADKIARTHFRRIARSASEREALTYEPLHLATLGTSFSVLLAEEGSEADGTADATRIRAIRQVWDGLIRSRALVLDEMAALHHAVVRSEAPEIAGLLSTRQQARERLARLVMRSPEPEEAKSYHEELRQLQSAVDRGERELARRSAEFRDYKKRLRIGFREVLSVLPPGSALVSFVRYNHLRLASDDSDDQPEVSDIQSDAGDQQTDEREEPSDEGDEAVPPFEPLPSYVALIVRSDHKIPAVVRLAEAERIDTLMERYQGLWSSEARGLPATRDNSEEEHREAGAALREAIWDPLLPHLGDAGLVFIVPDGAINLVSFAALPSGEDRYLVETGPMLHYLSSERDLTRAPRAGPGGAGLLALGGADYDLEPSGGAADAAAGAAADAAMGAATGAAVYRGPRAACESFQELRFAALPASKIEAEEIASLWKAGREEREDDAPRPKITVLTGAEASESALKEMAADHAVLHLATHGFFVQKDCRSTLDEARREAYPPPPAIVQRPAAVYDNPLLLSGLALAGANRRGEVDPEGAVEDGILTAEEIATIELSGVDWAVLSACETGVEEVRAGEGVLGLRRAFETAGAGTLIMSLWAVEDAAAREWMKRLYEARRSGVGVAEAIRQASLEVLRTRREAGRSTHPFYWGAFVAAGDWR